MQDSTYMKKKKIEVAPILMFFQEIKLKCQSLEF